MNDYDYPPDYDYPESSSTTVKKYVPKEKVDLAQIAPDEEQGTLSEIVMRGDLSKLTFKQRHEYVNTLCAIWKLDPLTKPFDWIDLDKKLVLYLNKGGTEQLRRVHGISVIKVEKSREGDMFFVTAYGKDASGREDVATGAVSLVTPEKSYFDKTKKQRVVVDLGGQPLSREAEINAILKCESKAKRRLTLSMGGLGMPSEDDIEDMKAVMKDVTPLEETAAQAEQIVEEAQINKKGTFKVGDDFKTGLEVHQLIADKIDAIASFEDLESYLAWKKLNSAMLKVYCKDNMDICHTYAEQVKEKEALLKAAVPDANIVDPV